MDYGLDTKSTRLKTFNTIFIITWLLIACFPFIWTFWGSFKVRADFFLDLIGGTLYQHLIHLLKQVENSQLMLTRKLGLKVNFGKHQKIQL